MKKGRSKARGILPVMAHPCATCPFREGSKYRFLAGDLAASALSENSRICHSTGTNAIGGRTGKPDRLCRGARDIQIKFFFHIGYITAPTDAAWADKCREMGLK